MKERTRPWEGRYMFTRKIPGTEARLGPGDTFSFSCHSGLACFNTCCRNKHLPLTPYDVLRLKRALGIFSDEFLTRYALYWTDPDTGFPSLCLRMGEEPEKACPFVTPEGCRVYGDRPTACRLYPLGRAAGRSAQGAGSEPFFFLLDTPGCLGRDEPGALRVEEWQEAQGLGPYLLMNDRMLDIVHHADRDRRRPLDQGQIQKVIVACYNLDVFREFVVKTRLADRLGQNVSKRAGWADDDTALLDLGLAYLQAGLFPRLDLKNP